MFIRILLILLFISFINGENLARGFGDNIHWCPVKKAYDEALLTKKPIMMILHRTWCSACKKIKEKFSRNVKIEELSSKFIMVNLENDEIPDKPEFEPDGDYVPRIFFADWNGKIDYSITSLEEKYRYFYPNTRSIFQSMKDALEKYGNILEEKTEL